VQVVALHEIRKRGLGCGRGRAIQALTAEVLVLLILLITRHVILADAVALWLFTGINFDAYEDIPVETSGRDVPNPATNFEELNLPGPLMENIRRCKFTKPTPVQRYAIPIGIAGRDLMACAQVRHTTCQQPAGYKRPAHSVRSWQQGHQKCL
jgi:hypothetical protein